MSKRKKKKRKKNIKKRKKKIKKKLTSRKKENQQTTDSDGNIVYKVSEKWSKQAYANKSQYEKKYKLSIKDNENFWKKRGQKNNLD